MSSASVAPVSSRASVSFRMKISTNSSGETEPADLMICVDVIDLDVSRLDALHFPTPMSELSINSVRCSALKADVSSRADRDVT